MGGRVHIEMFKPNPLTVNCKGCKYLERLNSGGEFEYCAFMYRTGMKRSSGVGKGNCDKYSTEKRANYKNNFVWRNVRNGKPK